MGMGKQIPQLRVSIPAMYIAKLPDIKLLSSQLLRHSRIDSTHVIGVNRIQTFSRYQRKLKVLQYLFAKTALSTLILTV